MKSITTNELKQGDVFTKEIKLRSRTSFEVAEAPKDKNFILIKERGIPAVSTKMEVSDKKKVYYLRNIFES